MTLRMFLSRVDRGRSSRWVFHGLKPAYMLLEIEGTKIGKFVHTDTINFLLRLASQR